jgi:hypothetical protein
MPALGFPLAGPLGGGLDPRSNITKLITAICQGGIQPLENCLRQLLTQRSLETAIGAQLDVIGALVNQERNGLDDETYRRYCRATISAQHSNGTVEDLIKVISLVVFDDSATYQVLPQGNATVIVRVPDLAISEALAGVVLSFLARTAGTGIRVIFEFGLVPGPQRFRFDSGPGFDVGHFAGRIEH